MNLTYLKNKIMEDRINKYFEENSFLNKEEFSEHLDKAFKLFDWILEYFDKYKFSYSKPELTTAESEVYSVSKAIVVSPIDWVIDFGVRFIDNQYAYTMLMISYNDLSNGNAKPMGISTSDFDKFEKRVKEEIERMVNVACTLYENLDKFE